MDLELKTLGQTLAVGGLFVAGVCYLLKLKTERWIPDFLRLPGEKLHLLHGALYLALIFGCGIIIEDFSAAYANQRAVVSTGATAPVFGVWEKIVFKTLDPFLDTDKELRLRSLFDVKEFDGTGNKGDKATLVLNDLSLDLWKALIPKEKKFRKDRKEKKELVKPRLLEHFQPFQKTLTAVYEQSNKKNAPDSTPNEKKAPVSMPDKLKNQNVHIEGEDLVTLTEAVNGLYYAAKNRVFKENNHFQELSTISNRIDFTRSIVLICVVLGGTYTLIATALLLQSHHVRPELLLACVGVIIGPFLIFNTITYAIVATSLFIGTVAIACMARLITIAKIAKSASMQKKPRVEHMLIWIAVVAAGVPFLANQLTYFRGLDWIETATAAWFTVFFSLLTVAVTVFEYTQYKSLFPEIGQRLKMLATLTSVCLFVIWIAVLSTEQMRQSYSGWAALPALVPVTLVSLAIATPGAARTWLLNTWLALFVSIHVARSTLEMAKSEETGKRQLEHRHPRPLDIDPDKADSDTAPDKAEVARELWAESDRVSQLRACNILRPGLCFVLALFFVAGAYRIEEERFNKRIFGYMLTILTEPESGRGDNQ